MANMFDRNAYYSNFNHGNDIVSIIGGILSSELQSLDSSYGFRFLALNHHKSIDSGAIYVEHVYDPSSGSHGSYYGNVRKYRCSVSQHALYRCEGSTHSLAMAKNIVDYMMGLFRQDIEMAFGKEMHKNVKPESSLMPEAYGEDGYSKIAGEYTGASGMKYAGFKEFFAEVAADDYEKKKPPVKKQSKKTVIVAIVSDESTKNIAKNLEL